MQKELKSLDRQLKSNGLCRLADATQKQDSSLFRALSMAVFYSPHYSAEVMSEIRLTLISNLGEKRNNAYPLIHESPVLKKYQAMPELLLDFWASPELPCFLNDVLVVASAAFGKNITVYSLDKDEYLNELYISACKNPRDQRLCLAKAGKKYYAVLPTATHDLLPFLRDKIIDSIVSSIFEGQSNGEMRQDRIHYPHYDEVVTNRRQHKKSLSDCGDIQVQVQAFEDRNKEFEESSDRGGSSFQPAAKPFDRYEDEFFDGGYSRGYSMEGTFEQPLPAYYNYSYPYYQQEAAFPYLQSAAPLNNERYTGRLKFFDQAGNYGFIVIDNLNLDLFVHYDDLSKAGLSKEKLLALKNNYELRFEFTYYEYEGKQHKKSKKAVDLQLIQE